MVEQVALREAATDGPSPFLCVWLQGLHPPAPADSGVRRHCARGGASQLRGWGSGREPGVSTRLGLGGALAGGTRLPGPRARRRDGLPGSPRRGGRAEGQDAGSWRRKLRRLT